MRKLIASLLFILAAFVLNATEPPINSQTEDNKIDALLTYVGTQTNVKFIRNGSEYDNTTAVKFLRGKWDRQRASVGSAREFIEKIASRSSTTGKPYRIRLSDGREVDSAVFLSDRLEKLEQTPPQ